MLEPVNDPPSEPRPPDSPDGGRGRRTDASESAERWMDREVEARKDRNNTRFPESVFLALTFSLPDIKRR